MFWGLPIKAEHWEKGALAPYYYGETWGESTKDCGCEKGLGLGIVGLADRGLGSWA